MRSWLLFLFLVFGFNAVEAADFKGFVEIQSGRKLYVDWHKAEAGQPTLILLNGLTYDTISWDQLSKQLRPSGYGIFRYDPKGMGRTLLQDGAVQAAIPIEDQVRDLDLLTQKVGLTGPLNLLGLSYGGGLAIAFTRDHAERVQTAILMCPYTEPLAQQDQGIRDQISWTRVMNPLNPASDDELYGYFLRQNVYFVYPTAEPSMLDNLLKPEAVFQMTQGIRKYNMFKASQNFPARSVHLIIAGNDQYIPRPVLNTFWDQLPESSRASRMVIDLSEHKIPENFPVFAAKWIEDIINNQAGLNEGRSFEANPETQVIIPVP